MRFPFVVRTRGRVLFALLFTMLFVFAFLAMRSLRPVTAQQPTGASQEGVPNIPAGSACRQTNLVSDIPGFAPIQDPLLVNPWGISMTASSPFWVANNGTGNAQLIRGDVSGAPVVLNAAPQTVTITGNLPTGTVANPFATDFILPGACASPPCRAFFLFASLTGNITGWNPNAPAAGSTTAVNAVAQPGRVYTGLAIGSNSGGNRLYAADFRNGNIDVYDATFAPTTVSGGFVDATIPTTPGNTYHPFNIQNLGGTNPLYVTYAKFDPVTGEEVAGVGNGFVPRFCTDGVGDPTFGIKKGAPYAPLGGGVLPPPFRVFCPPP